MEIWHKGEKACEVKRPRMLGYSGDSLGIRTSAYEVILSKSDVRRILNLTNEFDYWEEPIGDFEVEFVKYDWMEKQP